MLNGVKIDLLAAACFGVGDEKIGCFNTNQPWWFDPMYWSATKVYPIPHSANKAQKKYCEYKIATTSK